MKKVLYCTLIVSTIAFSSELPEMRSVESPPKRKSSPVVRRLIRSASAEMLPRPHEQQKHMAEKIALEEQRSLTPFKDRRSAPGKLQISDVINQFETDNPQ